MVRDGFPQVILIRNFENCGFTTADNYGFAKVRAKFNNIIGAILRR
jgi:GT2 family glycosyltransferase